MKMAKPTNAEFERVMRFANELDEKIKSSTDDALGRWVKDNYIWMGRVIFAYSVLADNCCDPESDVLNWKPEIAEAMKAAGLKV